MFVPLVDLTLDNGVTEFCLGTHTDTGISPEIVWQKQSWRDQIGHTASPVAMTAPAGSVVLFDYRVLHRGLANRSGAERWLGYFSYARPRDVSAVDETHFEATRSLFATFDHAA